MGAQAIARPEHVRLRYGSDLGARNSNVLEFEVAHRGELTQLRDFPLPDKQAVRCRSNEIAKFACAAPHGVKRVERSHNHFAEEPTSFCSRAGDDTRLQRGPLIAGEMPDFADFLIQTITGHGSLL